MDSFELNPDNITPRRTDDEVDPSALRGSEPTGKRKSRPKVRVDYGDPYSSPLFDRNEPVETRQPDTDPRPESPVESQKPSSTPQPTDSEEKVIEPIAREQQHQDNIAVDQHQNLATIVRFFADGRLRIFIGVMFILTAGFMLLASISYISSHSADQSVVANSTAAEIAAGPHDVHNSTGWFGAFLSHFLMYKWLGLGSFIIIFYICALGISLVRLHRFNFLRLTFKSLVAAIAISIIAGFLTYSSTSDALWGGQHGYWVNHGIIEAASRWGGLAVTILMLTALCLIFIQPLKKSLRHLKMLIDNYKHSLAERYRSSMAVAKAAINADNNPSADTEKQAGEEDTSIQPHETHPEETTDPDGQEINRVSPSEESPRPISVNVSTPGSPDQPPTATFTLTDPMVSPATTDIAQREPIVDLIDELAPNENENVAVAEKTSAEENPATEAETNQPAEPQREKAVFSLTDIQETPTTAAVEISRPTIEVAQVPGIEQKTAEDVLNSAPYDPRADLSHFKFPTIDLLHERQNNFVLTKEEQEENNNRIISTLDAYGIKIERIKATVGPTVTLYEIVPQTGTRISSIKRLGDDMALSLSAIGIRIIAPIPGKGTIGMEVPNKKPQIVGIRSILNSRAFTESKAALPIALGTTIENQVYVADLAKMPHLLVAGATGMGKSVGLNTIIASLLYKRHPAELKFVLVDPKMVEFSLYKCLERHYLAKLPIEDEPIITDPQKVVATLNSLCLEMDNRYALLSKAGMRGIKEYNEKFMSRRLNPEKGHRYLPYIVVIIDEFGDLILTAGKEVENPISRIAAKARAVGIHMILATQRPSVNVITGVIKANFPARMAFRVTQRNDSSTILDRPGAEQLIGRGDMLISRDGVLDRVQCAFIDTDEVEAICDHIAAQTGYPMAYELPEEPAPQSDGSAAGGAPGKLDDMFADAGRAIIEAGMGSASLLQRKFNIGYPRAGKLIDQLANAGVVGTSTGAGKPRPILMSLYDFERMLNNEL